MPRFEAYNVGVPYADSIHQKTTVPDAYEPAFSYYSRCLASPKDHNSNPSNFSTTSFMEIVQPDPELNYNTAPQQDIFKTGIHFPSTEW